MMALCPEALDMSKHDQENWYTKDAIEASAKLGEKGRDLILAQMRKVLAGGMEMKSH
jgi:hypothetical protein